ncbi:MAG TPA: hypothetical protein VGL05_10680 [Kribbella sp.]
MRWCAVTVSVLILLLAGCSDTPSDGPPAPPEPTPTSTGTSEPPPEPTDTESTQTKQRQPSISILSAPIGGNVEADGVNQCAEVNWLGRNPIPDGTTIVLGTPSLDPDGVFTFDESSCAGATRTCADVRWRSSAFAPCWIGVRQLRNGNGPVTLVIPVDATCATQADCDSLARGKGTSQITFDPAEIDTPPTETPTETPVETPSETPSGG